MAEKSTIEQIVGRAVAEVLEHHIPDLREEVVSRVLAELPADSGAAPAAAAPDLDLLLKAVSAIHAVSSQRDVLRSLLEHSLSYSGRAVLFVVKSGAATAWQARGFPDNDALKDFALDTKAALVRQVLDSRKSVSSSVNEMDKNFLAGFNAPAEGPCLLLPLLLKEKIAALIYADAGAGPLSKFNPAALEVLVVSTGSWLEVVSLRKAAPLQAAHDATALAPAPAAAASFSDPFAAHAPGHAKSAAAAASASSVIAAPAAADSPVSETHVAVAEPDAFSSLPPEEADIHRKAQRFARLLVDEIKLYNQAKVTEGRKNRDLYDQLKEDLDKSRATYQKRYGSTVAASADYFSQEVVRSLAVDDPTLMGRNFRR
jgi:hypothetical protein